MHPYKSIPCRHKCEMKNHPPAVLFCPKTKKRLFYSYKIPLLFLGALLSLYGLCCTIYSDIIVQNGSETLLSPYRYLSNDHAESKFDDLLYSDEINEQKRNLYLFIIDRSGSVQGRIQSPSLLYSYNDIIKHINDELATRYAGRTNPTLRDLAIAQLSYLLITLHKYRKGNGGTLDSFAIWDIGDDALKIYPEMESMKDVNQININRTVDMLLREAQNAPLAQNTNFASLFLRLLKQYNAELAENRKKNSYDGSRIIITVFSDLQHDVGPMVNNSQREIRESWNSLYSCLTEICSSNVAFNTVTLSEKTIDIGNSKLLTILHNNVEWYHLRNCAVPDLKCADFPYSTEISKKSIELYYVNPARIHDAYFVIESTKKNEIYIDIPAETITFSPISKVSLFCEIMDREDSKKRLVSGGTGIRASVERGNRIKISFSGPLPPQFSNPMVRISVQDEQRRFIVPILFIKRLPSYGAIVVIVLSSFMLLNIADLIFVTFYNSYCLMKSRKINKNDQTTAGGGVAASVSTNKLAP